MDPRPMGDVAKGTEMHSALYVGSLRHRRYLPRPHAFDYRLYMVWLDLAELDTVFRGRWLWSTRRPAVSWFKRTDYLGNSLVSLDQAVRARVEQETGKRPSGPVRVLTHLRTFGLCFNPVSFYYCYDEADRRVETIVAEITNTPWKQRHAYVLTAGSEAAAPLRFHFGKTFHVSPFMPMQLEYDWRFSVPGVRLAVHMENLRAGMRLFDATLCLERREMTTANLAGALALYPFLTAKVIAGIYWQALRLWVKRTPFYPHPTQPTNDKPA